MDNLMNLYRGFIKRKSSAPRQHAKTSLLLHCLLNRGEKIMAVTLNVIELVAIKWALNIVVLMKLFI